MTVSVRGDSPTYIYIYYIYIYYIYIYYIYIYYIHTHTNTRTVVRGILLWLGCAPPCGVENKVLARFFWEKKSSLGHLGANSLVSHP